jgi:hypothetical protein
MKTTSNLEQLGARRATVILAALDLVAQNDGPDETKNQLALGVDNVFVSNADQLDALWRFARSIGGQLQTHRNNKRAKHGNKRVTRQQTSTRRQQTSTRRQQTSTTRQQTSTATNEHNTATNEHTTATNDNKRGTNDAEERSPLWRNSRPIPAFSSFCGFMRGLGFHLVSFLALMISRRLQKATPSVKSTMKSCLRQCLLRVPALILLPQSSWLARRGTCCTNE